MWLNRLLTFHFRILGISQVCVCFGLFEGNVVPESPCPLWVIACREFLELVFQVSSFLLVDVNTIMAELAEEVRTPAVWNRTETGHGDSEQGGGNMGTSYSGVFSLYRLSKFSARCQQEKGNVRVLLTPVFLLTANIKHRFPLLIGLGKAATLNCSESGLSQKGPFQFVPAGMFLEDDTHSV